VLSSEANFIRVGNFPLEDFKKLFGHRATHDYELATPRYDESDELIQPLLEHALTLASPVIQSEPKIDHKITEMAVKRAQRFQSLKENAKHHVMRAVSTIRSVLLAINQRYGLQGAVFYLRCDELPLLVDAAGTKQALKLITRRRHRKNVFDKITLPVKITANDIECLIFDVTGKLHKREIIESGHLQGTRVSGDREISGKVVIVDDPDSFNEETFVDGDIIVARFTDPRWIPLFPRAGGFVGECGGWLSHMAIIAREHNLPCIVGVEDVMNRLEPGQEVRLCANGLVDRRCKPKRRQVNRRISNDNYSQERRGNDRRKIVDRREVAA